MIHYIRGNPVRSNGQLGPKLTVIKIALTISPKLNVLGVDTSGKTLKKKWQFQRKLVVKCSADQDSYEIDSRISIDVVVDTRKDTLIFRNQSIPFRICDVFFVEVDENGRVSFQKQDSEEANAGKEAKKE